jgi:dihydropteroate synthase
MSKLLPLTVVSRWQVGSRCIDLSQRPHIMGVLNVTPDSFSDGAAYHDTDRAVARALEMEAEGADSIDIGGESTRPSAEPVSVEEELRRVIPVIAKLAGRLKIPISVDTYKAVVAQEALCAGAEIVNDISGCTFDPLMPAVVAASSAGLIVMHTRERPAHMQHNTAYADLVPEVLAFLRERICRLASSGIAAERIVVDPGIGFGKDLQGNLELIRRLREFSALGRPILLGASRKSFIGAVLGRDIDERIFGTAAAVAVAVVNGASLLRVHDVREMRDVALMARALLPHTPG